MVLIGCLMLCVVCPPLGFLCVCIIGGGMLLDLMCGNDN